MKPMKLSSERVQHVADYIADPAWVLEQKMDGTRGLVHVQISAEGEFTFEWFAGSGGELKFAAATRRLPGIEAGLTLAISSATERTMWLDGEIMIDTGEFRIFDFPMPSVAYLSRREELDLAVSPNEVIKIVRTTRDAAEKQALFDLVKAEGGEGVVAKRIDGEYEPGKRSKQARKLKFIKTADVIVQEYRRGRNAQGREIGSAKFGVYENGRWVPLGSCSLIGKPQVQEGSVIEVAYLFRGDGGKLVQPRLTRLRHDKPAEECGMDQFQEYSRVAV